jgi:hypothetical protein
MGLNSLSKSKLFGGLLFFLWTACVFCYLFLADVDEKGLINWSDTRRALRVTFIVGFASGFIGWFWMMFDCAAMNKGSKKTIWSVLLAIGNIFGATAYYIVVYLQSSGKSN